MKAYQKNKNFKYPRNLFFVIGWYPSSWWVGPMEEQISLLKKYNCTAEQRKSLIPYTIAVSTSGTMVLNYSTLADNGFVSYSLELL